MSTVRASRAVRAIPNSRGLAKIADREDGRGVTILPRLLGLPGQGWRVRETDGKRWRRPMHKNGLPIDVLIDV
ncbi:jg2880 [Pararge aegeria aegeria]|uniref:Jg2880 protein n=1 Tax=Pararge aegeria aegeria TaxID=348720 RepID=A0A8S4SGE2_9NEOP|nr:jg2880 [Pararge aegeria aegeria]